MELFEYPQRVMGLMDSLFFLFAWLCGLPRIRPEGLRGQAILIE